ERAARTAAGNTSRLFGSNAYSCRAGGSPGTGWRASQAAGSAARGGQNSIRSARPTFGSSGFASIARRC
ncbi:MAG: hypothetical protein KGJ37_07180, partial [Verrucomicrobiota bacterium]|nr:hypothetical protein [Verrucomicrobiota bacterium]